jgi:dihydropteroate synthase
VRVRQLQPIAFRRLTLDFSRTYLMGVCNVTPDSFSDGNQHYEASAAVARAEALVRAGADLIDVGGESTRPGATRVGAAEEWARIEPVVRALAGRVTVSVDTYKAEVADAALQAGAELVNDVSGGTLDPELLRVCALHRAKLVLGHLRGTPADMAGRAEYRDVVREVRDELAERLARAVERGVAREQIFVDPGLGFAKTGGHNLTLLAHLRALAELGRPIVVGASRKSFLGQLTGKAPGDRELATAAADTAAVLNGAHVVRVHDVAAQRDAVLVADAIRRAS